MNHERRLLDALGPLCEPLHDALTESVARVRQQLPELDLPGTRPGFVHTCRAVAYRKLLGCDLNGWTLREGQNNVGVTLTQSTHAVRLLHQVRGGHAPHPGTNDARRRYFANPTLSDTLLPPVDKLLALWAYQDSGEVSIRIVRPIGSWSFGHKAKVDLDFILPTTSLALDDIVFQGAEEDDLDVFVEREEGTDDGQSGFAS